MALPPLSAELGLIPGLCGSRAREGKVTPVGWRVWQPVISPNAQALKTDTLPTGP